jgi:hypothetical protein
MPRVNRREIFAGDEIQAFHLINRCVRRTYLCGKDKKWSIRFLCGFGMILLFGQRHDARP